MTESSVHSHEDLMLLLNTISNCQRHYDSGAYDDDLFDFYAKVVNKASSLSQRYGVSIHSIWYPDNDI